MTEEMKIRMFERTLEFEKFSMMNTYDNINYSDKANGAYEMLEILGLGREYIKWTEDKLFAE